MNSLRLLLMFVLCAGAGASQEAAARRDVPPGLVVLKLKWERRLDVSRDGSRPARGVGRTVSEPDAVNNPVELPTVSRSPYPPHVYQYTVEVRNDGAKKIRWVSWDYVLSEPDGRRELGRHGFVSAEKIGPGERKTLSGKSRSTPGQGSAERPGKEKGAAHEERVEFRCVAYEDGTWWHSPSVRESECVEAERRGKSR